MPTLEQIWTQHIDDVESACASVIDKTSMDPGVLNRVRRFLQELHWVNYRVVVTPLVDVSADNELVVEFIRNREGEAIYRLSFWFEIQPHTDEKEPQDRWSLVSRSEWGGYICGGEMRLTSRRLDQPLSISLGFAFEFMEWVETEVARRDTLIDDDDETP